MARSRATSTSTLVTIPRSEPSDSTQSSSKRPGCRELAKTCTRRGNYVRCLRTCELTPLHQGQKPSRDRRPVVRGTHTRAKTLRAVDRNVREAMVRIITARAGLEQVDAAMAALMPTLILAADRPSR
jgi:hypothetical protein